MMTGFKILADKFAKDVINLVRPRVEQQLLEELKQVLLRDFVQSPAAPKPRKALRKTKAAAKVKPTAHPAVVKPTKKAKNVSETLSTEWVEVATFEKPSKKTQKAAQRILDVMGAKKTTAPAQPEIVEVSPGRFELTVKGRTYRATRKRDLYRYLNR